MNYFPDNAYDSTKNLSSCKPISWISPDGKTENNTANGSLEKTGGVILADSNAFLKSDGKYIVVVVGKKGAIGIKSPLVQTGNKHHHRPMTYS